MPAKVDTGADSSSVWASDITIDRDGVLHFRLFAKGSEHYTGELISRKEFKVAQVASSTGHVQIRYRTQLSVEVEGKTIRALFNLSDRSANKFPMLIGRRTIAAKFLVDVTKGIAPKKRFSGNALNKELKKDPYAFFQKHRNDTYNEQSKRSHS